jgi:hypothetical protein
MNKDEALRLADKLDDTEHRDILLEKEAANELRRLHEEIGFAHRAQKDMEATAGKAWATVALRDAEILRHQLALTCRYKLRPLVNGESTRANGTRREK